MDPTRKLWELLEAQNGVVRTSQALALGMSRGRLRSLVERGILEQLYRGVLRATASARRFEQEVTVGSLLASRHDCARPTAAAYGITAAVLLDVMDPRLEPIHIVTTRKLRERDGFVFHWTTRLPEAEIISVRGAPCTDPPRTLLDVFDIAPPLGRFVYRRALRNKLLTPDGLRERVKAEARSGRGGLVLARTLLDETDPTAAKARSGLEDRYFDMFVRAGYTPPERNVRFPASAGHEWEVDLFFPELSQGFEVSPYATHSHPEVHARDGRKELDLARLGIKLWRFTEELSQPEFERVIAPILGAPRHSHRDSGCGGATLRGRNG